MIVTYERDASAGRRGRNTEIITFDDEDKITRTEVYFGCDLEQPLPLDLHLGAQRIGSARIDYSTTVFRRQMLRGLTVAALLAAALPPTAAGAATVRLEPSGTRTVLVVEGAPGEANRLLVVYDMRSVKVSDNGGTPLTAAPPCSQRDATTVECPTPTTEASARILAGDGDDTVDSRLNGAPFSAPSIIDGGDGNDELVNSSKYTNRVDIRGGRGDDRLVGGVANELLSPGPGNDIVEGNAGHDGIVLGPDAGEPPLDTTADADTVSGGRGLDGVYYANRTDGINVSLNDRADDGATGERDNLAGDIEGVDATAGDDRFFLDGAVQSVSARGLGGNDVIVGSPKGDRIEGGDGDDTLIGGAGKDTIDGGSGADELSSRDAPLLTPLGQQEPYRDDVICGEGNDLVSSVDLIEFIALKDSDCETVRRPLDAPVITVDGPKEGVTRSGRNHVVLRTVTCAANARADCQGRYYLYSGTTLVARGRLTLAPGVSGAVKLKLTGAGKKLLRRHTSIGTLASVLTNGQGSWKLGVFRLER